MRYSEEELKVMATIVVERLADGKCEQFNEFEVHKAHKLVMTLSVMLNLTPHEVVAKIHELYEA